MYDERLDPRSAAPIARGSHSSISARSRSETSPNASQKASQSPRHSASVVVGTSGFGLPDQVVAARDQGGDAIRAPAATIAAIHAPRE